MTWTDEDGDVRYGEPWEPEWPEASAGPEYAMYASVPAGTEL